MPEWFIQLAIGLVITGIISLIIHSIRLQNVTQQKEMDATRESHQKQITLLFQKHDEDVERLRGVEMRLASDHYVKPELDAKFDKIEMAVKQGFHEVSQSLKSMGDRFDTLGNQLIHLAGGNGAKK